MGWQFLTEITMSHDEAPIYRGSFSGSKFIEELKYYNQHKKETITSLYELEVVDFNFEVTIYTLNNWDIFDTVEMVFDGNNKHIACIERENRSTFEIPWQIEKGKETFANYIFNKYVIPELDLNNDKSKAVYKVNLNAEECDKALKEISQHLENLRLNDDMITTGTSTTISGYTIDGATTGTTTASSNYYYTTTNTDYNNYNNPSIVIDTEGLKIGGWNVGDYINTANPAANKQGDSKKMNFNNFDFGPVSGDKIHMSICGVAILNKANRWVSYDTKNKEIVDVEILNFKGNNFLYKIPVAIKDVAIGDVIVHNNMPMFVTDINCASDDTKKILSFVAIDPYAGEEKTILPTKNMFNFNFVTKIVSLMDSFGGLQASEDQPFGNLLPFMILSNDKTNIDPMIFMMMSQNINMDQNMLLWLSMMEKDGANKDILSTLLMMNMKKN